MGGNWQGPDDDVIEGPRAEAKIRKAVNDHLHNHQGGVLTSLEQGMDGVKRDLKRGNMPNGIDSWSLPVLSDGGAFVFLTTAAPGAVVPNHSHKRDLFRVVISGSIILDDGKVLKSGDWMFVPKGTSYGYKAATNPGAITLHFYE
jgi:quercetin dioxygenase-like cupin family protein